MKHRLWTSKQKSQIVLEGLSGQIDINQFCQKYQISQTQFYKWRELFLTNCHQSFEIKKQATTKQHLGSQVKKLRSIRSIRAYLSSKDNSDTERVMRTIKEDLVWTNYWDNPFASQEALKKWGNDYNTDYPHQSLNNKTPTQYFETFSQQIKEPDSTLKSPG